LVLQACGPWELLGDCANCLDAASFEQDYREKSPVIVLGLIDAWQARTKWGKQTLLKEHGNASVEIDHASSVSNPHRLSKTVTLDEGLRIIESNPDM
jgi:hypothetical protein